MTIKAHDDLDVSDLLSRVTGMSPWEETVAFSIRLTSEHNEVSRRFSHDLGFFRVYAHVTIDTKQDYINIQFEH